MKYNRPNSSRGSAEATTKYLNSPPKDIMKGDLISATISGARNAKERRAAAVALRVQEYVLRLEEFEVRDAVEVLQINASSIRTELHRLVQANFLVTKAHPKDKRRVIYQLASEPQAIQTLQERVAAFRGKDASPCRPTGNAYEQFLEAWTSAHSQDTHSKRWMRYVEIAMDRLRASESEEGGPLAAESIQAFLFLQRLKIEFFAESFVDQELAWRLEHLMTIFKDQDTALFDDARLFYRHVQRLTLTDSGEAAVYRQTLTPMRLSIDREAMTVCSLYDDYAINPDWLYLRYRRSRDIEAHAEHWLEVRLKSHVSAQERNTTNKFLSGQSSIVEEVTTDELHSGQISMFEASEIHDMTESVHLERISMSDKNNFSAMRYRYSTDQPSNQPSQIELLMADMESLRKETSPPAEG